MSSPPSLFNKHLYPLSDHLRQNNETFYDLPTLFISEASEVDK